MDISIGIGLIGIDIFVLKDIMFYVDYLVCLFV